MENGVCALCMELNKLIYWNLGGLKWLLLLLKNEITYYNFSMMCVYGKQSLCFAR